MQHCSVPLGRLWFYKGDAYQKEVENDIGWYDIQI